MNPDSNTMGMLELLGLTARRFIRFLFWSFMLVLQPGNGARVGMTAFSGHLLTAWTLDYPASDFTGGIAIDSRQPRPKAPGLWRWRCLIFFNCFPTPAQIPKSRLFDV
jgi:hypothetical protein